ncbi:tail sheath protein [uncultured Caudovirales phage]|uniref:Tail sheath protein n=1 Tax=uncultured Caudovirales phage TaxID=2100421 RepID=A0A6J5MBK7_9CAUD|nr:tail sheath protein [uncultured Caudovirales phage]
MAEKIVSPGVFTNEKDLSFLPAGIAAIGAAIVGPTAKGPAFVPTIVSNFNDFISMFGGLSEETYVPYAVKSYLRNASAVTVVRILQEGGYKIPGALTIIHSSSAHGFRIVGVALPSSKNDASNGITNGVDLTKTLVAFNGGTSATSSFALTLSGSGFTTQAISGSAVTTNNISLDKVLGTNVKTSKNAYMYLWFSDFLGTAANTGSGATLSLTSGSATDLLNLSGSTDGAYRPAVTPYITSQIIAGQANPTSLFRFYTLADGADTNTSVKISIINQSLPTATAYGTFTVVVRDYADTDQRPNVLESFSNLTLDPDSVDFIARRIGDRYKQINSTGDAVTIYGDYDNISKYIRVDVDSDVKAGGTSLALYPKGFRALNETFNHSTYNMVTASYVIQDVVINGSYNKKAYYGWDFSIADNANYLKPVPNGADAGLNANFNLDNSFVHPSASAVDSNSSFTPGGLISAGTFRGLDVSNILKYTVPFQNGFDGDDPGVIKKVGSAITATNTQGLNCLNASSAGSQAYNKALNVLQNQEEYDMNLLVTPGITIANHTSVVNKAVDVAETRGDTFYIADPVVQGSSIGTVINALDNSGIDSSYVGTYWPWVKIIDTDKNKPVWVPPSVVLPNIFAYNDNVAFEWFAPAGLNRGGITEAVDIELKLTFAQRDSLYENNINPVATFPGQGICVWGQKTLQVKSSALDRINVRRLLIALKKFIASSTRYLVFENNTTETRQRFLNIVNPYLERVKARQGLYAFRVVMDETNNTPDIIDRNQMYGQIFIQPAKTAEFIVLDFNILPTGASFENA